MKVEEESLLGVTHEQAAMVIKTAMASNSHTLNLLLAQIPNGRFKSDSMQVGISIVQVLHRVVNVSMSSIVLGI